MERNDGREEERRTREERMYELKENVVSLMAAEGNTEDMRPTSTFRQLRWSGGQQVAAGCAIAAPAMRWKQSFNLAHHQVENWRCHGIPLPTAEYEQRGVLVM